MQSYDWSALDRRGHDDRSDSRRNDDELENNKAFSTYIPFQTTRSAYIHLRVLCAEYSAAVVDCHCHCYDCC